MTSSRIQLTDEQAYEQYPQMLELLTGACRTINLLPLAAMQQANERMQTLGPLLEPTAYIRGGSQNLHDQRRVIDAALRLQRVCEEVAGVTDA